MPNDWSVSIPYGQDKQTSTTRHERKLGTIGYTPDGRRFVWCFSDGTIGAGQVATAKVPTAVHDMDLAVAAAAAVGDMTISLTVGAGAITANQFEDGILYINDGAGEGHCYHIKSHPAIASGGTGVFTLWEPVREALTTATSLAGLMENRHKDCVVSPTTTVNEVLGVAPTEIADNTYFWAQQSGVAAVLIQGTVVLGQEVTPSQTTAGAVDAANYAGTAEWPNIGTVCGVVAVDTDYGVIDLHIR